MLLVRVTDCLQRAEGAQQRLPPDRPDSLDLIQDGMCLRLSSQRPVKLNREAVCFILYPRNQLKTLRGGNDGVQGPDAGEAGEGEGMQNARGGAGARQRGGL